MLPRSWNVSILCSSYTLHSLTNTSKGDDNSDSEPEIAEDFNLAAPDGDNAFTEGGATDVWGGPAEKETAWNGGEVVEESSW